MNIYTLDFKAKCPVNDAVIDYTLRIHSAGTIKVEELQAVLARHPTGFHEDIADDLFAQFGGVQTMHAVHHGVAIETRRQGDLRATHLIDAIVDELSATITETQANRILAYVDNYARPA